MSERTRVLGEGEFRVVGVGIGEDLARDGVVLGNGAVGGEGAKGREAAAAGDNGVVGGVTVVGGGLDEEGLEEAVGVDRRFQLFVVGVAGRHGAYVVFTGVKAREGEMDELRLWG